VVFQPNTFADHVLDDLAVVPVSSIAARAATMRAGRRCMNPSPRRGCDQTWAPQGEPIRIPQRIRLDIVRTMRRFSCFARSGSCDSTAKSTYASSSTTHACDRKSTRSTDGRRATFPWGVGVTRNFSGRVVHQLGRPREHLAARVGEALRRGPRIDMSSGYVGVGYATAVSPPANARNTARAGHRAISDADLRLIEPKCFAMARRAGAASAG